MTSLNKKCFALEPCDLRDRCALATTPQSLTRLYFQPSRVGEHCDHFTPHRNWRDEEGND